jgi:hypothetical protein
MISCISWDVFEVTFLSWPALRFDKSEFRSLYPANLSGSMFFKMCQYITCTLSWFLCPEYGGVFEKEDCLLYLYTRVFITLYLTKDVVPLELWKYPVPFAKPLCIIV